jgi:hypothetical protein
MTAKTQYLSEARRLSGHTLYFTPQFNITLLLLDTKCLLLGSCVYFTPLHSHRFQEMKFRVLINTQTHAN